MIVYFFILSLALLIYYVGYKYHNHIIRAFSLLTLITFSGFRYKVGLDFTSYWWIYENIDNCLTEPAYKTICKILSIANFGAQLHFVVCAAITLILIEKSIRYYNNNHAVFCLFLYLFFGFYVDSFNIIRQSIAIAIFFWSGKYIINGQLKKYILSIICASLFHLSAIILIPFYFILSRDYSKIKISIALVFSLIASYSGIIGRLIGYLPIYVDYLDPTNAFNVNSNLGIGFVCKYIIGFILLLSKNKIIKIYPYGNIALNSYFWYLILMGMLQDYLVFLRIAYYFQIYLIIALPALVMTMKRNGSSIITRGIIIIYGCLILFMQTNDNRTKLLPYKMNFDIYQKEIEI